MRLQLAFISSLAFFVYAVLWFGCTGQQEQPAKTPGGTNSTSSEPEEAQPQPEDQEALAATKGGQLTN